MFTCSKCTIPKEDCERRGRGWCKSCHAAYCKIWREFNKSKVLECWEAYYGKNKDSRIDAAKQWNKENPESHNSGAKKWRDNNPGKVLEFSRNRRARTKAAEGSFTIEEFTALKKSYGNVCLACRKPEGLVKLTADHVLPLALGGSNWIHNIQPLCVSCNCSKKDTFVDYRCAA